ncbi:major facilitator superfamily MFS_1 [[Actinomadura] parvosata subsp. kistnae]|uniref:MFS transporter n=1 Tax=[Actinomadura] parvosata TaxID=1955412 RepID=UPI000D2C59BD|nr:MFS transporter [Nonomuraea sp. ATCC 55076]SPL99079.1 major facilitator superfamily MFS_1 [Actinomadura parvosata subsp. kistnae]
MTPALRRYVTADGFSQFGTQVTRVALPLVALLVLDAGPFELGLLGAAEMIGFLLFGLPAGVWVDRLRRKPILVTADVLRAVSLASVPVAALFDALTLAQLYAVAVIVSIGTAFFDVAHMSFLPSIVTKEQLPKGMGTLESVRSLAGLFGPGLGGWLVQVLTAPIAIVADAVSYLISAVLLASVKAEETPAGGRVSLMEGLRYVLGHPILRLVGLVGAMNMFVSGIWAIVRPLYLVDELGVGAAAYGLMISGAGVGGLLGAFVAARVIARFGHGPTMFGAAALMLPLFVLVAFTGPGWRLALYPIGMALISLVAVLHNVAQGSYRQAICPEALRGRMNASLRFLMWGSLPLGGVVGGLLGEAVTVHQLLWIGSLGSVVANLPFVLVPAVRKLKITDDGGRGSTAARAPASPPRSAR